MILCKIPINVSRFKVINDYNLLSVFYCVGSVQIITIVETYRTANSNYTSVHLNLVLCKIKNHVILTTLSLITNFSKCRTLKFKYKNLCMDTHCYSLFTVLTNPMFGRHEKKIENR